MEVISVLALALAMFAVGFVAAYWSSMRETKGFLDAKTEEFTAVTRSAADANNSLGRKIVELQNRIEVLEFRHNAVVKK